MDQVINLEKPYTVEIEADLSCCVEIGLSVGTTTGGGGVPYNGEYSADPKPYKQEFATKDKYMKDNFTVNEILVLEAPNEYGTTLTIGA
jgi:hypothetical protein